jgi:hypothetical protein
VGTDATRCGIERCASIVDGDAGGTRRATDGPTYGDRPPGATFIVVEAIDDRRVSRRVR